MWNLGVVRYGKNWKQVKEIIGTRQEKQIQSHHQKYLRRVAKMVKKIKRKGPHHSLQDLELAAEAELYRQLFTSKDITAATPCQIKAMITCLCPEDRNSPPRMKRNIIITDPVQEYPASLFNLKTPSFCHFGMS